MISTEFGHGHGERFQSLESRGIWGDRDVAEKISVRTEAWANPVHPQELGDRLTYSHPLEVELAVVREFPLGQVDKAILGIPIDATERPSGIYRSRRSACQIPFINSGVLSVKEPGTVRAYGEARGLNLKTEVNDPGKTGAIATNGIDAGVLDAEGADKVEKPTVGAETSASKIYEVG
ncbi:hypothetical protein [Fimbriimonas ginsengisoli]|uniref:hypothetical protein n=1 Tax=Fimbriimonas ginsengisoli TaxID=1005039 RepID=UPI00046D26BB|nr:hypothetical protein [Fimbriimonas ginsengisoli]